MSLCLAAGSKVTAFAFTAFTLSWTHSVERVRWEEDWYLQANRLAITEARVQGSGAGMEPASDATLMNGWWRWTPDLPPQRSLVLAASGATGGGWTICSQDKTACREIGKQSADPVTIAPCDALP